jgi:hypothetical protein
MDCGDVAADWINRALGTSRLRLVYAAGGMKERMSSMFFGEDGGIRTGADNKVAFWLICWESVNSKVVSK